MQSRRWWLAAFLTVLLGGAGAPAVHAAAKPALDLSTASISDMTSFAQKHAKDLQAACRAGKLDVAARVRDEVLGVLDPASKPPAKGVFDYSGEVVTAFAPQLRVNAKADPNVTIEAANNALALNAAVIVCNPALDYLTNDRALGEALQNRSAGVRYWAAKGIDAHMPSLVVQLPVAVVGTGGGNGLLRIIKADLTGKKEVSALVAGRLHVALVHTVLAVRDTPIAAQLLNVMGDSMVQRADAWQKAAPSEADITSATESLAALVEVVGKPANLDLGAARGNVLSATCGYMSYALQWDAQQKANPANDPISPEVYQLVTKGSALIEAATGFVPPALTPSTPALDALLQVNGAVGPGGGFFAKFKDINQPGNIPAGEK